MSEQQLTEEVMAPENEMTAATKSPEGAEVETAKEDNNNGEEKDKVEEMEVNEGEENIILKSSNKGKNKSKN